MAGTNPPADPKDRFPYEVRDSEGKGLGCFATRDIKVGEVVLEERCGIICDECEYRSDRVRSMMDSYLKLSEQDRAQYLNLHASKEAKVEEALYDTLEKMSIPEDQKDEYARLYMVFLANSFAIQDPTYNADGTIEPGKEGLFLNASRFNHSCDNNVIYSAMGIPGYWVAVANREIKKGAELTISYIPLYHLREKRQRILLETWCFRCLCNRCSGWDEDYDKDLLEACRAQGLLPKEKEAPPDEEPGHAVLRKRVECLQKLEWFPALFFAHQNLATYCTYRGEELEQDGSVEQARLFLAESEFNLERAVALGMSIWGTKDIFVLDMHTELSQIRIRLRKYWPPHNPNPSGG
ncbi:SET domain-containing protein [Hypoxylon sp. FL0890]|nr:SET domain-containing protein [Hypoxylon sp. FL0890]